LIPFFAALGSPASAESAARAADPVFRLTAGELPQVVINEVMASNAAFFADPQNQYDDWIELYNAGTTPLDLGGLYLTDDPDDPTQWQIPVGVPNLTAVPARGYLVVWADGDTGDSGLHANFRLNAGGDEVHLFAKDGTTLIDSIVFGDQTADISYGRYPDGGADLRFFGEPTPGQRNSEGFLGEVAPLRFSHERGYYSTAFNLTITTDTEDAEILFTVDGTAPEESGFRVSPGQTYVGPLRISRTICIRAAAIKPGWKPTRIYTHTYVFDTRSNVKSLPIISLVGSATKTFYEPDGVMAIVGGTYSGGVWTATGPDSYNNVLSRGLERPVSAEWLPSDDDADFQIDCGLRVHGSGWMRPRYRRQNGYWSGNGKFSFRLYFRGEYGSSVLDYPLFPESDVEQFDSVVLRGGHNDRTNPFIKDELLRRLHRDMGQMACMGTFANLFINGEYKGYFNPTEHVKEESCQRWFDSDQPWDVMTMNGIRDGDTRSWDQMMSYARSHNLADPIYYEEMGKRLDIVSFIDYLIIRLWPNDWDWPQNNWSAACERSAEGRWKFFVWDAEGTFRSDQLSAIRFNELNSQGNANGVLYRALKVSPDFRRLFGDRLFKHFYNGGALTAGNIQRHFYEMREELKGVIPSMNTYIITGWTPNRERIFLDACVREGVYTFIGPTFSVDGVPLHGGRVNAGDQLEISTFLGGGSTYYTLDGTDPAQSTSYQRPPVTALVARDAEKRVLVPTGPLATDWRGIRSISDASWLQSSGLPGGVGYERSSGYETHISVDLQEQMYNTNGSCYIRIPFEFHGDKSALAAMTLRIQYDDGFVAYLNSQEIARRNFNGEPAWNSRASTNHDDGAAVVFEAIDITEHFDKLRLGDNLLAIQGLNASLTSSDLLIGVELTVSEEVTMEPPEDMQLYTAPIPLTESTQVKARLLAGTTWSALTEATFAVGPVQQSLRISEIMYHPVDPNAEYVELTNISTEPINLNLVRFSDGVDFTFANTLLAPGDFCLVVRDRAAFDALYGPDLPVAGEYTGSLNDAGERVELQDAAGAVIHDFQYHDDWFDLTDGSGFSLTVRDVTVPVYHWKYAEAWRSSVVLGGSPGVDDGGETLTPGSVVINELLANSAGLGPDWIELHNATDQAIDIGGWFLSDDADDLMRYEIAAGTIVGPQGYLVLDESQHFGNPADPGCHEPFGLSGDGETVYLHSGAQGALTGYREQGEFGPSEPGATFGRYANGAGGFDLVLLTEPTPGAPNADPVIGPVVITEFLYNLGDAGDVEYVELLNITDADVTLYDFDRGAPWRFTDDPDNPGIEFLFPEDPPITLEPLTYLLLVKDHELLKSRYYTPSPVQVYEWGAGKLSNAGETIQLSRPGDLDDEGVRHWISVDRVCYSDGSQRDRFPSGIDPWPAFADGLGLSLVRIAFDQYGNDPSNWQPSVPSPGAAKQRVVP
jgi:hypothetical protein